ncbi:hypothetical protein [Aliivibrio fischeri]|uniref:hypothetical protein n=1 Tax=Aliivibrio fischeri TaxID=668 RepID=UPI0007C555A7|nr:hypothetical protein [Aliivibrio fischeri]
MNSQQYQPIWYQRNRPFAKYCKQIVEQYGLTNTSLQCIQEKIFGEWNKALEDNQINQDEINTDLMPEISLAFYHGAFSANGSNLFSFTEHIGEMLSATKADQVPMSALKSPYPNYYIQFHKPVMWGNLEISGAYIIDNEQIPVLQVALTITPLDHSLHWMSSPSGYFYLPLERDGNKELGEVIQSCIDKEIILKWESATKSMPIKSESIVDVRTQRAKRETMDLSSGRESIQKAMEYVANCLCYLSSHTEFVTSYPNDAPASLVQKSLTAQSEKQKNKAESQLKSMGHHKITYIRLNENTQTSHGIGPSGTSIKQHWRRGHWRNQPIGKGLSEYKLLWIKPTLVGESKSEDDIREYRLS